MKNKRKRGEKRKEKKGGGMKGLKPRKKKRMERGKKRMEVEKKTLK